MGKKNGMITAATHINIARLRRARNVNGGPTLIVPFALVLIVRHIDISKLLMKYFNMINILIGNTVVEIQEL